MSLNDRGSIPIKCKMHVSLALVSKKHAAIASIYWPIVHPQRYRPKWLALLNPPPPSPTHLYACKVVNNCELYSMFNRLLISILTCWWAAAAPDSLLCHLVQRQGQGKLMQWKRRLNWTRTENCLSQADLRWIIVMKTSWENGFTFG